MRFPNAYKGVSRIYLAEILSLVAAILGIQRGGSIRGYLLYEV